MTARRPILRAAILLTAAFAAGESQDRPALSDSARRSIEQAVLDVNARMTRAAEDRDVDRMFSFILDTDKGSIIQNGNLMLTRAQALAQVKAGFRGIAKVEYRWKSRQVTVVSPTVALLVAEGESSATTEQGDTIGAPFVQTAIFVLRDGEWKVLHAHQSSPPRR